MKNPTAFIRVLFEKVNGATRMLEYDLYSHNTTLNHPASEGPIERVFEEELLNYPWHTELKKVTTKQTCLIQLVGKLRIIPADPHTFTAASMTFKLDDLHISDKTLEELEDMDDYPDNFCTPHIEHQHVRR